MKKTFNIFLTLFVIFAWCFTIAQDQVHSIGKAPMSQRPHINLGTPSDLLPIGYGGGGDIVGDYWYNVDVPTGALTNLGTLTGYHQGGDFDGSGVFYACMATTNMLIMLIWLLE